MFWKSKPDTKVKEAVAKWRSEFWAGWDKNSQDGKITLKGLLVARYVRTIYGGYYEAVAPEMQPVVHAFLTDYHNGGTPEQVDRRKAIVLNP